MTLIDNNAAQMPPDVCKLYEAAFPPEERRTWAPRPEGLRLRVARGDDGSFLGFVTTWQLPDDVTYVEHLATLPSLRGQGIGGRIIDDLPERVVLEVELPETEEARRRIGFYERHGFTAATEQEYIQPPYGPDLPSVPMLIMYRGDVDTIEAAHHLHRIVYGATSP